MNLDIQTLRMERELARYGETQTHADSSTVTNSAESLDSNTSVQTVPSTDCSAFPDALETSIQ